MTPFDYAVIALYAVGMLAVGFYYSRQSRTATDYLLGGRNMSPLMIGLSLFATLTSTLSYLALPGEMIKNGPVIFSELLVFPLIFVIVGWVLIPRIMAQPVTSGYELLEARLGLTGRLLGAGMFVLLRVFWMATILFATATTVLIPMLFPDDHGEGQRWMPVIAAVMGALTLGYTVLGGLKAVVMTDAIQAILMFLGAIVAIVVVSEELGGTAAWWPTAWPAHWAEVVIWPTPGVSRTVMGACMSLLVWMVCTAGSDQMSIQRYLATRDAAAARRSFGVQLLSNMLVMLLLGLAGVAVLGYFLARPEAVPAGASVAGGGADKLLPHFIMTGLPMGLRGLVIAAILSAAMSSLSSGMNSSAAVLVEDFIGRAAGKRFTPLGEVHAARLLSIAVGVIAVLLSLVVGGLAKNLLELCFKVVNLLTAPIFVLFFLALFVPRATPFAAICATVASVGAASTFAFGFDGKYFLWSPPSALVVGVVVGSVASLVLGRGPRVDGKSV